MTTTEVTPQTPEFDLADRCVKARKVADLSQEELSDRTGISVRTITRYETHVRTRPSKLVLRQWAFACGVDYDWLIGGASAAGKAGPGRDTPDTADEGDASLRLSHLGSDLHEDDVQRAA